MPPKKGRSHSTADHAKASGPKSLYETMGLDKSATQADIKKAYHKLALQLHPDKNPGDEEAHGQFQALQRVFAVLGDPEKRKIYDETGSLEDSEDLSSEAYTSLYDYYRTVYPKVTEDDIKNFYTEYRGSGKETADLLRLYEQFHGDMHSVFEWQLCSEAKLDSHRFMDTIEAAIEKGEVERYHSFSRWAKKTVAKPRPKDPLKPRKRRKAEAAADQDLALQIRSRGNERFDKMLEGLEAKHMASKRRKQ